jgi:hypothetical protein
MVAMNQLLQTFKRSRGEMLNVVRLAGKPAIVFVVLLAASFLSAQNTPQASPPEQTSPDYSGMYSFLQEGEFIQLTVEDEGRISGFVSRYGDSEASSGAFVDHFIKQGKLAGKKLSFSTETVKGISFDFKGTVERGPGKNSGDEGYYVLKGVLTRHEVGADNKATAKSQEVAFKSFPQDIDIAPDK